MAVHKYGECVCTPNTPNVIVMRDRAMNYQKKVNMPLLLELMISCVKKKIREFIRLPTDNIYLRTPQTQGKLLQST